MGRVKRDNYTSNYARVGSLMTRSKSFRKTYQMPKQLSPVISPPGTSEISLARLPDRSTGTGKHCIREVAKVM